MASGPYSFIDIAVLEEVRARFAAGDALAILSVDLDEVIWANGPGAALFGYPDIEAVMGASPGLGFAARRQISAVPGFPRMGRDRAVLVRLASGTTSRAVPFLVSAVTLPDGVPAVLMAVPARMPGSLGGDEAAARIIEGFKEAGYYAALVDAAGNISAASHGFADLAIADETLSRLVAEVAQESDRLVKRLVPAGDRLIPAGIARLTDEPALHLLIAIDAPVEEIAEDEEGAEAETAAPIEPPAAGELPAPSDADLPERVEEDFEAETVEEQGRPTAGAERATPGGKDADSWYFDRPESAAAVAPPAEDDGAGTAESPLPPPDLASGPIRFVWRTDADGAFSTVSEEFVTAVGPQAADIIGRPFPEVAARLNLDPEGEIAGLLGRRDTWSGRSVLWPVAGTDLVVPVDLAALPVYSRDRAFEGFRGFGVARMGDAIVDPVGLGLKLAAAEEDVPAQDAESGPFSDEAPAPIASFAEQPQQPSGEKVISLAERRPQQAATSQLSAGERNAFEEIRERLRRDYPADEENHEPTTTPGEVVPESATEDVVDQPYPVAADGTSEPTDNADGEDLVADEQGHEPAGADTTDEVPEEVTEDIFDQPHLAAMDATEDTGDEDPVANECHDEPAGADAAEEHPEEVAEDVFDRPHLAATDASADAGDEDSIADEWHDEPASADTTDEVPQEAKEDDFDQPHLAATDEVSDAEDGVFDQFDAEHPVPGDAPHGTDEPKAVEAALPDRLTPPIAAAGFLPSAFSADKGRIEVDPDLIAGLPLPLLVHAGDDLYFANREFLALTGYASLDQARREGGLERLFVDRGPETATGPEGRKLILRTLGGEEFPVDAHLQSIRWRRGSALLLALRRAEVPTATRAPTAPAAPIIVPAVEDADDERAELERHVAEMRTIIDTATDGVVLIANDGTIRNISRPAEALFGFDSAEVEGKPFASLFAIESQRAARDYLAGLSENGVASVLNDGREVIGREAEGRFIPLFMTIGRLPSNSGYCAVVRDITQWKRAEEELTQARARAERASSQKTEFLARVSHEIRTPLNAIIGFSELMIDEKFGPVGSDRYRDYLRDINRSGNHVLDLVNDLLDISKIEAGEQEMHYEAVSLNDTLAESVAMMQPQANGERVIIRSSLASRLPDVVADLRSVRQIALNLLSNAIRYTQAGGQVIVSTSYEASGDVVMRVRDTGIGMSLSEIDQALKPFKQINALKRGRHEGTGLGLPLTKAMVEANRARFVITSTPGEGTMVEITFPSTRVLAD